MKIARTKLKKKKMLMSENIEEPLRQPGLEESSQYP